MKKPSVTYVVSAYDRPQSLRMTLASLQCQTDHDFEVIVADNNPNVSEYHGHAWNNQRIVIDMDDTRFKYVNTSRQFEVLRVPRDAELVEVVVQHRRAVVNHPCGVSVRCRCARV